MCLIPLILIALQNPSGESTPDKRFFPHSSAKRVLSSQGDRTAAGFVADHVQRGRPSSAFIAEDGSALAVRVGTVTKVDANTGAMLTRDDRYRLEIRNGTLTAFNVSQETYIRKSSKGAVDVSLQPVVLLDRYQTLCVNGDPSKNTLYVVLIDDRQRGARPNRVRSLKLREDVNPAMVQAVGKTGKEYVLAFAFASGTRYLAVAPDTLATRWVDTPRWPGFWHDRKAIGKAYPSLILHSQTRWKGGTYFLGSPSYGAPLTGYMWREDRLNRIGSQYMPAASINGRFGWLVDRDKGHQWILEDSGSPRRSIPSTPRGARTSHRTNQTAPTHHQSPERATSQSEGREPW